MEFQVPLTRICNRTNFDPQLKTLMQLLYDHAPTHVQVFGVFPAVASCTKLKQELQRGEQVSWGSYSTYVHATVLLNFLQHLPDPLLTHRMYKDWMELIGTPKSLLAMKAQILRLAKLLPEASQTLLKHLLVVLRRICQNVPRTHTTPILAGYFVGPSLLWELDGKSVLHPAHEFHYRLAKLVKYLIVFMDDIWNDIDEEAMFGGPSPVPCTPDKGEGPSTFLHQNPPMFVDELQQESCRNMLLEEMINSPSEYKPFRSSLPLSYKHSPSTTASSRTLLDLSGTGSRSSRTWPGYARKHGGKGDGSLDRNKLNSGTSKALSDKAKVATFPRCNPSGNVAEDLDTGIPIGFHSSGEEYLYPNWVFLYPAWNLPGDELPGWAQSGFTLDVNCLVEHTMHKWKQFFADLLKSTVHSIRKDKPNPGHKMPLGTQF